MEMIWRRSDNTNTRVKNSKRDGSRTSMNVNDFLGDMFTCHTSADFGLISSFSVHSFHKYSLSHLLYAVRREKEKSNIISVFPKRTNFSPKRTNQFFDFFEFFSLTLLCRAK